MPMNFQDRNDLTERFRRRVQAVTGNLPDGRSTGYLLQAIQQDPQARRMAEILATPDNEIDPEGGATPVLEPTRSAVPVERITAELPAARIIQVEGPAGVQRPQGGKAFETVSSVQEGTAEVQKMEDEEREKSLDARRRQLEAEQQARQAEAQKAEAEAQAKAAEEDAPKASRRGR